MVQTFVSEPHVALVQSWTGWPLAAKTVKIHPIGEYQARFVAGSQPQLESLCRP